MRERVGKPDPRIKTLEAELARIREDLAAARADRDNLVQALREAVGKLRSAVPRQ